MEISIKPGADRKYIDERSIENGDFSYDMLATDDFNGGDILVDSSQEICDVVMHKIMLDKLRDSLVMLSDNKRSVFQKSIGA